MPKYGDNTRLYGDSDYTYGVDGTNPSGIYQWLLLIDWDGNGTYAYNEGAYMLDCAIERGRKGYVLGDGNGFEPIDIGSGRILLDNTTRRFDPDYTAGPLYGKIKPNRKFKLLVKDLEQDVTYPLMAGFIYDIPPVSHRESVQLVLRDTMKMLDNEVSIPDLYRNTVTNAVNWLLDKALWPAAFGRAVDSEDQIVTSFNVRNINALETVQALADACLGQVFADRNGQLRFYSRAHSTWTTHVLTQAECHKEIRKSRPWENLRNYVKVIANKKVKSREEPIWQLPGPLLIPASGSKVLWIDFGEAIDLQVYELEANSLVTGKGTDRSSSISVDLDIYSGSMEITISNSYASDVYLISLVVTGRPITTQPISHVEKDDTSIGTEGYLAFKLDSPWLQSSNHADAFSEMILEHLLTGPRTIELKIENRSLLQFGMELLDKVDFTSTALGVDEVFHLGYIAHEWNGSGNSVVTTMVLQSRLTNSDSISNDPEDPNLPYIPETPYIPGIPITIPPDDPGTGDGEPPAIGESCYADPDAESNGPYTLYGLPDALRDNGGSVYAHLANNVPFVARSSNATNPTQVVIEITQEDWNGIAGDWEEANADADYFDAWLLDYNGDRVIAAQKTRLAANQWLLTFLAPSYFVARLVEIVFKDAYKNDDALTFDYADSNPVTIDSTSLYTISSSTYTRQEIDNGWLKFSWNVKANLNFGNYYAAHLLRLDTNTPPGSAFQFYDIEYMMSSNLYLRPWFTNMWGGAYAGPMTTSWDNGLGAHSVTNQEYGSATTLPLSDPTNENQLFRSTTPLQQTTPFRTTLQVLANGTGYISLATLIYASSTAQWGMVQDWYIHLAAEKRLVFGGAQIYNICGL